MEARNRAKPQKSKSRAIREVTESFGDPVVTNGNGHSGPGIYVHEREYPDEGSLFLEPELLVEIVTTALALDREKEMERGS